MSKKNAFSKFLFKDEEDSPSSGGNTENSSYYVAEVKLPAASEKVSAPVKTQADAASLIDQKLFADLMSRVHSTQSTYLQLLQQLKALEPFIPDERMRFEAAFTTLKTANVKKRDIIAAVETHEGVLEEELKKFQNSMESELQENLGAKREELRNISQQIKDKEEEISIIQKEIVSLKSQKASTEQYISGREKKVALAKQAFNLVYNEIKKILNANKNNITNLIKGE